MLHEDPKPNPVFGLASHPDDPAGPQSAAGLNIDRTDVRSCLAEVEILIRGAWEPAVHLELRLESGLPLVACSRDDLQNAILNLLLNARDAMPNGGLISIDATEIADRRGGIIELRIRDNGVGMTRATMLRAFDPFFTTKDTGLGGFGLPIVKQLAEQNGGSVDIDSAVGAGTTVILRLPAKRGSAG